MIDACVPVGASHRHRRPQSRVVCQAPAEQCTGAAMRAVERFHRPVSGYPARRFAKFNRRRAVLRMTQRRRSRVTCVLTLALLTASAGSAHALSLLGAEVTGEFSVNGGSTNLFDPENNKVPDFQFGNSLNVPGNGTNIVPIVDSLVEFGYEGVRRPHSLPPISRAAANADASIDRDGHSRVASWNVIAFECLGSPSSFSRSQLVEAVSVVGRSRLSRCLRRADGTKQLPLDVCCTYPCVLAAAAMVSLFKCPAAERSSATKPVRPEMLGPERIGATSRPQVQQAKRERARPPARARWEVALTVGRPNGFGHGDGGPE